jgi:hypothetical protein
MRRLVVLALVAFGSAAVAGCYDVDRSGFEVINRLSVPIDVVYVRAGNRIPIITDLDSGKSVEVNQFVGRGECENASLIAMDQSGSVVATFPGPVCDGTDWEVGPLASPSPGG